jgi:hypothetical protein
VSTIRYNGTLIHCLQCECYPLLKIEMGQIRDSVSVGHCARERF